MRDVDWRMCLRFINEGKIGRKQPLRHGCAAPPPLSGEASRCGGGGADRGVRPYKNVVIEKWKGER